MVTIKNSLHHGKKGMQITVLVVLFILYGLLFLLFIFLTIRCFSVYITASGFHYDTTLQFWNIDYYLRTSFLRSISTFNYFKVFSNWSVSNNSTYAGWLNSMNPTNENSSLLAHKYSSWLYNETLEGFQNRKTLGENILKLSANNLHQTWDDAFLKETTITFPLLNNPMYSTLNYSSNFLAYASTFLLDIQYLANSFHALTDSIIASDNSSTAYRSASESILSKVKFIVETGIQHLLQDLEGRYYDLFSVVTGVVETNFNTMFYTIFFLFLAMTVIVFFLVFLLLWLNELWMFDGLSSYNLLKMYELQSQLAVLKDCQLVFERSIFNEMDQILLYQNFSHMKDVRNSRARQQELDHFIGNNQHRHLYSSMNKNVKIVKNGMLKGVAIVVGANIFFALVWTALSIFLLLIKKELSNTATLRRQVLSAGIGAIEVNNNLMSLELLASFNSTFLLNSRSVLLDTYKSAPQSYAGLFINNRQSLKTIMDKHFTRLDDILNGNLCSYYSSSDVFNKKFFSKLCTELNDQTAQKGFISFLLFEQEMLTQLRHQMLSKMNSSSSNAATPADVYSNMNLSFYFDPMFASLRLLHVTIFDTFIHHFEIIMSDAINDILALTKTNIVVFEIVSMLFFVFVLTLVSYICLKRISHDYKIAMTTFRLIFPQIVLENPYLLNKFKHFFDYRLNHDL